MRHPVVFADFAWQDLSDDSQHRAVRPKKEHFMRRLLCEMVADLVIRRRLEEAFDTLGRLPVKHWPQGYRLAHGTGAPDERVRREPRNARLTPREISEAHEALDWLAHLRGETDQVRRAVQLRARDQSLREIAPQLGCSHVWAGKLEARGVAVIVAALHRLGSLPQTLAISSPIPLPDRPPVMRRVRLQ